ncbi:YceI family protein [Winogradskyella undariae]|uniref:YceI family protein n=1 Tax=Winogradskyella TaxID=286104 RepID=UPI00156BB336|nr:MULTISPECIES: YceI family protein [Winogradskyella]NRR91818.1 YceI family protein [Winogradskyella undariae]QXP78026.1 YceI family protein [Winogradskyella sp. HaHa_3_26]
MKTNFLRIFTLITFIAFTSCGDKAKEADTKQAEDVAGSKSDIVTYKVDTDKSVIEWKGFKPTGSHNGTIAIKGGKISTSEGIVKGGKFVIEMNGIIVKDIPVEEEGNAKLKSHLESADFFDVQTYPNSMFVITGFKTNNESVMMLSGNLTLKETTKNISFPIKIKSIDDNSIMILSDSFTIDRSKWNIKHGSKSFFDNLGDKFINDEIELKINLTATK